MTSQDVFDRAYLILRNSGVNRGAYAVDVNGASCPTEDGVKFCAAGALFRASLELNTGPEAYSEALHRLQERINDTTPSELGVVSITTWNDAYATDDDIIGTFRAFATPTLDMLEATTA